MKNRYRLHPAIKDILSKKITKEEYLLLTQFYLKKLRGYTVGSKKCTQYLIVEFENVINLIDKSYKEGEYSLVTSLWETISYYVFYIGEWSLMYKYDVLIQNSYKRAKNLRGLAQYILEDIGRIYFFQKNHKKIKDTFIVTTSIARSINDVTLMGVIKSKQGIIYFYANDLKKSEVHFLEAIKILVKTNRREELTKSYAYLSLVYAKLLNYEKVIKYSNMAIREYDVLNNDAVWGFVCVFIGLAFYYINNNKYAEKYLLQGYRFEKKYHIKIGEAIGLQGLGFFYLREGNKKKGITYLNRALILYNELGMKNEEKEINLQMRLL